ncbi:mismatch repair ATPase [Martiniozyma asiatica (nom. inval.)]|nr:mismatch repair ATPase [Martiniozyma asiatica]
MDDFNRIQPLSADVVNKIAAGEIILAPSNALKELLENSIDASATQIDVLAKQGGLKLLQIQDNGSGIHKEDMPILAERFTTSKLKVFDDLKSIATYGFRGEALSSISHVGRLTVISKTLQGTCAWRCKYTNGELENNNIELVAGNTGTIIQVEDLFYNIPARLRALKSYNEEYAKIVDVVSKYAVHVNNVGFSCQRQDGKTSVDLMVRNGMSRKDRLKVIYGSNIANNLIEIKYYNEVNSDDLGLLSFEGAITNLNYENKKPIQPIFFINNRLVVCDPLRRAINSVYSTYLPKGHRPFVYLSLIIKPQNVDVNVHPTKREVRFLNEEEIIEFIIGELETKLGSLDSSRKFMAQQVLSDRGSTDDQRPNKKAKTNIRYTELPLAKEKKSVASLNAFRKPYEHEMVRTDYSQSTLNSFVKNGGSISSQQDSKQKYKDTAVETGLFVNDEDTEYENNDKNSTDILSNTSKTVERSQIKLVSIKELRDEVKERAFSSLTEIFAQHTFVGIADYNKRLLCLQYDVKLYLVDYGSIFAELFYQIGLADFANFGRIVIEGGVDMCNLVQTEILSNFKDGQEAQVAQNQNVALQMSNEELKDSITQCFLEMSEMWEEYFCINIVQRDGSIYLDSLPLMVKNYIPPWSKLALFIWRVITRVEFEDEKACLGGILRQLALFYIPSSVDETTGNKALQKETLEAVENILMPCLKRKFIATENITRDIVEIANLPGLYKVFERC